MIAKKFDLIFSFSLSHSSSFLFHYCLYRCLFLWKSNTLTYVHISMSERNMDLYLLLSSLNRILFSYPSSSLSKLRCLCYDLARSWPYSYFLCQSVTNLFAYIHTFFASVSFCCSLFFLHLFCVHDNVI